MSQSHQLTVSVVIPAYNESDYIERCLQSLVGQLVKPLEIIVVDNNSTDDTAELARAMGAKVITEHQQGIVFARDAGFKAASGDIIARCDADSILPPTWIKQILEAFEDDPKLDAITGPANFINVPKGMEKMLPTMKEMHSLIYFKGSRVMLGHDVLFGSNMAITKSIWKKIVDQVCTDESKIHEDIDISIHIHDAGGKIKFDRKLVVSVSARMRPGTVQAKSSPTELMAYLSRWSSTRSLHSPGKKSRR